MVAIELPDELMARVALEARDHGESVSWFVESVLRRALAIPVRQRSGRFRLDLPVVRGRSLPDVDLTRRDPLYERMEGRH